MTTVDPARTRRPGPATAAAYLDVRELAHELRVAQADLVRSLQDDGIEVIPLSSRRWRVAAASWESWLESRRALAADQARQRQMRAKHVAGKDERPPVDAPRVRFRR